MNEAQLATRVSIAQLVATFSRCEADLRAAFALLAGVERDLGAAFGREPSDTFFVTGKHFNRPNYQHPGDSVEVLKRKAWRYLIERLDVRSFMSNSAWSDLVRKIEKDEVVPEITIENVNALLADFQARASGMLNDAVQEVFEFLRPHFSHHKSNSEFEVPRKVVLTWMIERGFGRVRDEREQHLIALENVLGMLSGKGTSCKTIKSKLSNAIRLSPKGDTEFFFYRAFNNGNLHLTFKDPDILAKFNSAAGGARLRKAGVTNEKQTSTRSGDQDNGNEESNQEGSREEDHDQEGPREEGGEEGREEGNQEGS